VQLKPCLWVIAVSVMLAACAGPRLAQDLQAGKASFEAGYYKEAFRQLLPIAVKGKAEAQYAVGYMYYYGYGVSEDTESGIFWMTKAAEQHYPPAVKALEVIHRPTPEFQSSIPIRQSAGSQVVMPDQRQQYIPVNSSKKLRPVAYTEPKEIPTEPPVKLASAIKEKQVLRQEDPTHQYALQLYGSYHLDSVKDLQLRLRLKNTGHVYQTTHEGKDWYVLTFGHFVSAREASATQHNLPSGLKELHPWVRDVNELRLV